MTSRSYTVFYQPIPSEEGKGYYAHIPALGITTDGKTMKEAKEMAQDAIEGYLEAAKEIGKLIPKEGTIEHVEVLV